MREILRIAHSVRMSTEDTELAEVMLYGEIVQDYSKYYKEQYPNDKSASAVTKCFFIGIRSCENIKKRLIV